MRRTKADNSEVTRGTNLARHVFDELELRHPTEVPIETLAMMRGALVRDVRLSGAQGRLTRIGKRATISVSSDIDYEPRRRFVIAHEIGHLEMHQDRDNQLAACTAAQIREVYDQGAEREANSFASEFLMPQRLWQSRVEVPKPNLRVVRELADEFEVSFVAAAIRFVKLTPERCCLMFSKNNRVEWFAASADFGFWVDRGAELDPYSLAYDYFHKGSVSEHPETVSATAWLQSPRLTNDHDLVEHCVAIPSLSATVSLLWISADADF